jgi:hypothetical protein
MIWKLITRLLTCILIVTFWMQLLLLSWYLRLIATNIPWDKDNAILIYIYAVGIFSPILLTSSEILWNQRWVDIKGFYRNGLLQVVLVLSLVLFYLMTFFNQYILNGIVLPNLAFMAMFMLSIIVYLNIRGRGTRD